MELSNVDHNEPHDRNSPGKNIDFNNAFKQQLMEYLGESIQALRLEHQNTDHLMSGLRQEVQKAVGDILVSCQRMELDIGQCRGLLNDVLNKSCIRSEESQGEAVGGTIPATVGKQTPGHSSGGPMPAASGEHACASAQIFDIFENSSMKTQVADQSTVLTQILHKIENHERKQEQVKRFVDSHCQCYLSKCVPSILVRLVHNAAFNDLCAVITLTFAVVAGFEADVQIRAALDGQSFPSWLRPLVSCFNLWFVAEVSVRIFTDGTQYFLDNNNRRWNVFDMVIAILSLVDMVAGTGSFGFLRVLRAMKVVKALRVVRLLKMFRDLRLLIASMLTSLVSLIWSMVFLVMVTYLAAVTLVDAAAMYIKDDENAVVEPIQDLYHSLSQAMYTLLMCITGGMDWREAAAPAWNLGWFYGYIFIFYILFCLLGILNVITSIFVERAANMKKHDRDYAVSEELLKMEEEIEATIGLFETLTENGDREIQIEHLEEILMDKRVIAHFASIGIEISDRTFIAHIIGDNTGGPVDTKGFVRGCLSLRGTAKQSDTQAIILHVKKLEAVVEEMMRGLAHNLKKLANLPAKSAHLGRDAKHVESRDWGRFGKDSGSVEFELAIDDSSLMMPNRSLTSL